MALRNKLIAGGLAALALVATTAAASAAPAYATSNVNVRSGPGTYYGVVDTLRRGEQVDVQQCQGSWCYVEKRGPDGWVSSSYLERGGRPGWNDDDGWNRPPHWNNPRPPQYPRPPHWNPRPPQYPVYPGYPGYGRPNYGGNGGNVCFNGPQGYVCIGN
jgi:hypothetical protein